MKKIKTQYKLLTVALALAFTSTSVQALLIDATLLSGSNRSIADSGGAPNRVSQQTTASVSQFDADKGVLMSVTATLTPDSSAYLRADGANSARGTASISATWNGVSGLNVSGLLNTAAKNANADGTDNSWNTLNQIITNPSALDSWVGVGTGSLDTTVRTTLTADWSSGGALTARIGSSGDNNQETLTDLPASYSVEYSYLEHAVPSFDGSSTVRELTLDFGDVNLGDTATREFSLFNLTGDNGVGLDLDSILASDDTSVLTTNLMPFTELDLDPLSADNNYNFSAAFDTSNLGEFSATYYLWLSDADVGASSSRDSFGLTLHLTGNVIEQSISPAQVNDIPEPGMMALVSLGLFSLLGLARRKGF